MTMMEEKKKRTREEMLEDFIAAYDYLKSHKDCNGQVLWDFVLRLDCQYDGGESSYSISSSALLWRTAHCSEETNNNTATAALRRFRQP
jgi:hypothetical protein